MQNNNQTETFNKKIDFRYVLGKCTGVAIIGEGVATLLTNSFPGASQVNLFSFRQFFALGAQFSSCAYREYADTYPTSENEWNIKRPSIQGFIKYCIKYSYDVYVKKNPEDFFKIILGGIGMGNMYNIVGMGQNYINSTNPKLNLLSETLGPIAAEAGTSIFENLYPFNIFTESFKGKFINNLLGGLGLGIASFLDRKLGISDVARKLAHSIYDQALGQDHNPYKMATDHMDNSQAETTGNVNDSKEEL